MEVVGLLAAAAQDAEHLGAARHARSPAIPAPARPSLRPARSRRGPCEKGLEAFSGASLLVDSADSSEKRISASAVAEPSAPMASARSHLAAADRLDAELDRGGARGAGGRQRDRQAARAEAVGQPVGDGAELGRLEDAAASFRSRADLQQALIAAFGSVGRQCRARSGRASPARPAARRGTAGRRSGRCRSPASASASRAAVSASS